MHWYILSFLFSCVVLSRLSVDSRVESVETIRTKVADAITNGSLLEITDDKGATTLVPGEQIGYVELGSEEKRRVGFGVGA